MFRYEREMLPVIEAEFSKKYKSAKFVREFNSGNGVSDLTFALHKSDCNHIQINNYSEMFYLVKYFNRVNKRVNITSLIQKDNLDKQTLKNLVRKLENHKYIVANGDDYIVKRVYKSTVKKIISIEAKLQKWKDGLYQAMRYQCFSHKSYLAISSDKIKNVDIQLFIKYNIGLISVSKDKIKIEIEPSIEKPKDIITYYHLAENMMAC